MNTWSLDRSFRREVPDGELVYAADFLERSEADALLETALALPDWEQHRLCLFGREVLAPRLSAWYGDPGAAYSYSGVALEARPWPAAILALRECLCAERGLEFDSVLANLYRDGNDTTGWHSDDERSLGRNPTIASLSLGATRRFLLRHRTRKDLETIELPLAHGSLLVMSGAMQHHWRHSLPRTRRPMPPRVNLTFRRVLGSQNVRRGSGIVQR